MKIANPALIAFLNNSTQFAMADLYTFTLSSGIVMRCTCADAELTVFGRLFSPARIQRSQVRLVAGIEVDTLDITLHAALGEPIGGLPLIGSLNAGALDGAYVVLERAIMPTFGDTSLGTVSLFSGRVADIRFGRTETKIQVKSALERLNIPMPRNLYQPGCLHTLYDVGCGLDKTALGVDDVVQSAAATTVRGTQTRIDGTFDLGVLHFSGGRNTGASYTVKSYTDGQFVLMRPMLNIPEFGDRFVAYPGCEKTQTACSGKFGNLARFRGYPYIPAPEIAY